MADDDNKNGYWNSGSVTGGLLGAAAGVAFISNPASVLGSLGVGLTESGGGVAAVAAGAAVSVLPVVLGVLALMAVGGLVGGLIVHHFHKKAAEEQAATHTVTIETTRSKSVSVPAPALAPAQATSMEWTKKLDQAKAEPGISGRGAA